MDMETEEGLWLDVHAGCEDAKLELYLRYSSFMRSVVYRRFQRTGIDSYHLDDCYQEGAEALLKAIGSFDSSRGASFKTYCAIRIDGAVLNVIPRLSDRSNAYAVAKKQQDEAISSLVDAREGATLHELADLIVAMAYSHILELEDGEESDAPYQSAVLQDVKKTLKIYISQLSPQERFVVEAYYFGELNFTGIAELLDLTKGRVSQLHRTALEKARIMFRRGTLEA